MAYTSSDLTAVCSAIITLATRESTEVEIDGKRVKYGRSDIQFLRELKADIEHDLAGDNDDGGLHLIKPMGRQSGL